ncbi:MAG: hypothetical protein HY928_00220, partial [Elusimicrobia bacterium]|nr:hypothetical protein [Elusimicrobiota bacterium]
MGTPRADGVKAAAGLALAALLGAAAAAGVFSGSGVEVRPGTTDAGGAHGATGGIYETAPSVGETASGRMTGGVYDMRTGHADRAARPRSVTDLTASQVSLSSMTLAWSAPGADGNRGALAPGSSYYIQAEANATPAWAYSSAGVKLSTSGLPAGFRASHRMTGLLANSTYYFRVWHRDEGGRLSRLSNETTAYTLAQPVTGAQLYAVFGTSATANWAPHPAGPPEDSAEGYRLEASTTPAFTGVILSSATGELSQSTLTVVEIAPQTTYYLRVGALNRAGVAHYVALSTVTTTAFGLPPSSAQIEWVGTSSAAMRWNPVNPLGYVLEASTAPDFTGDADVETANSIPLSGGLTAAGLDPNTTYYLRAGALWDATTYYAPASTRSTLAPPVNPLAAPFLAVDESSATAAWAATAPWPPAAMKDSAQGYRLEASTAPNFTGTVVASVTYSLSASTLSVFSPALSADSTYYFRVGSLNHESVGNYTVLGASPTLTAAPAAAVSQVYSSSIAASWTPISAQGYRLEACDTAVCDGAVFFSSTTNGSAAGLGVEGLSANTTYYLRAGGLTHDGRRHLGPVFASTATLAAAIAPAFAMVYTASVTLSWTPVSSQGYALQASKNGDFSGTVHSSTTKVGSVPALTAFSPALESNTTYFFRVGAVNHNGVPNFALQAATPTAAVTPQALAPAVLMVAETSATWNWAARPAAPLAQTAEGYLLEASAADDFSGTLVSSMTADIFVSTLTAKSPALDRNTTYYFRVAALNHAGVPGPPLVLGSTSTLAQVPTSLQAPFIGVFPTSMTVAWAALPAAPQAQSSRGYLLEASGVSDFSSGVISSRTAVVSASSLSVFSPALSVNDTYYFRVAALNHNSVPGPFLIYGATATAASPAGQGSPPIVTVTSHSILAQWTSGSPANPAGTVYHLRASPTSDFSGTVRSSATTGFTAEVRFLQPDTTYYVQVMALNRKGYPTYSTMGDTITLTGDLTLLSNTFTGVFQTSMTASWAAGGGSGGYRLEASPTSDFSGAIVSSQTSVVSASTLTVFTPALSANTTYYFRAAARNSGGVVGPYTALGSTSTTAAAPSALAEAYLSVNASSVTAAWAALPSAPLASTNEGYILQASTRSDFTGAVFSTATESVLVSTLTILSPPLGAHATYYFRVGSLNHNGVPGAFLSLGSTPTWTAYLDDAAVSVVNLTSITVSWSVIASSGYVLDASSTAFGGLAPGGGVSVSSRTTNPNLGTLSVLSPALWPNTTYFLRAGGLNHQGVPAYSFFGANSTLANQASGPQFQDVGPTSVTVSWVGLPTAAAKGSSNTSEGYILEASTAPNFGGNLRSSSTPNVSLSTLTVTALLAQTTYYFRVGSLNWDGTPNYIAAGSTGNFVNPNDTPWLVQEYTGTMTTLNLDVDIQPVYSQDRAFILAPSGQMSVGVGSLNASQDAIEVYTRARFLTDAKVRLTRGSANNGSIYSFYVIENPSGSDIYVASGQAAFGAAATQVDVTNISGIQDWTRTVVFLTVSNDSANTAYYHQSHVRAAMTSNTNLRLQRTGGNTQADVNYFVVEFRSPKWTIQTGEFTLNTGTDASPQTQAISAVNSTARTWVYMNWSATVNGNDEDAAKVELTNTNTLSFSRNLIAAGSSNICRWYVLEHPDISVQRGNSASLATDFTVAQNIAPIDTSLSFPVVFNDDSRSGIRAPSSYWSAKFNSSSQLLYSRARTSNSGNFKWQVVSLVSEIAPNAVTNLSALVGTNTGEVELSWTSPGDDADSGLLSAGSQYRIHYTTSSTLANQANFFSSGAAQVQIATSAVIPGSTRGHLVEGLFNNTTYFMRLWTRDEGAIYSGLSNGATVATRAQALVSPGVLAVYPSSITAAWEAFPDPAAYGSSSSAVGYLLEASSTDFGAAFPGLALVSSQTYVYSQSTLSVAGGAGLDPNTTYYLRAASLNHAEVGTYAVLPSTPTLPIAPTALAQTFLSVGLSSVTAGWAARPTTPSSKTAEGFLLQASTAPDFTGVPVSTETVDVLVSTLSVNAPALANNTTYYFRVGTLGHSHGANFILLGSTVTLARAPGSLGANKTYLAVFPSSVTVAWTGFPLASVHGASNSAQGFLLEASSTNFGAQTPGGVVHSSFTTSVLASTLTVLAPALDPNTTYYFRVASLNHIGALTTLALGSTTTLTLPPPPNGDPFLQVNRTSATLQWGALPTSPPQPSSASSFGFRLDASTAPDFTGTLLSSFTPNVQLSTLTIWNPPLDANTTYYFRAATLNHRGVSHYALFGATPTLTAPPQALAPNFLGVFQTSVTAEWAALPESPPTASAEGYVLQASSTNFGALSPGGGVVSSTATPNVLLSTMTVALPPLERNTTYYFKVFGLTHVGTLGEPLVLGSTVTLPASPQTLAAPFLGVFQTSVTAAWAAMPASPQEDSAYGYRLEASSTNFGALLPGGVTVSSSTYDRLVSTLTVRAPALDRDTTYYFRVSALNAGGHAGPFTVLGTTATLTAAPDAPTPLQVFESSSTWDWPAFPAPPGDLSAAGYLLEASQASDFSSGVSSTRTPVAALSALTVSAPALDANTTYYFRVAALNPNDVPVYAAVVSTSQRAMPPTALAADSTFIGVFGTSVTVRWTALPGAPLKDSAEGYHLEASSTGFDGTGDVPTVRSAVFSQNTLTVFAPALERNTTYYFRVAGRNHNGLPGAYAALYATSTMAGAPQAGANPILSVFPSSITAAWVSPPALPQSESAQGFRLDASTAADFSGTLASSQTFARTASTLTVSSPALSENTTYYLRAAALNHNGVPGPFTALGSTLTLLGSPTLITPPFLAVFETSATARWAAKPGGGYRVDASSTDFGALTPGGTTRSSQTFVASASTLTVSALDADTTYYFRLAALNLAHDPGPFAVVGATATLAVAPSGTSPVFLAVNESSVTANWAAAPAVPQAASAQGYRLDASLSADFSGAVVSSQTSLRTVSALSVFSPALSADATYYFRVSALNHNGVPGTPLSLGATATLTVEVPGGSVYQAWPSSLTVSWIDVAAQGYRLEASAASDFSGTLHSSETSNGDITLLSVQAPALSVNTTYYLRVGPLNHNGVPHFSAAFSSPTLAAPATAVSVSAAYFSSVTVAWTPQTAAGFQLAASTASDFSGTLRSSTSWVPSKNSLSVLNLLSGTTYYLRVAALNHAGAPHYSVAVATKTGEAPKVWTGGGGDGDWFNDNNWSPPGVPTRNDSVTINLAAAVFAGAGSPAIAFSSMTLGAAVGGPAVSLRVSSAIEAGTNILLNRDSGLTLDTTQVLTLTGDLTLRAGSSMTHTASPAVSTSAYASWDIGGVFNLEAGATV